MAAVPTIGRATGVERRPTAPEADATRALYERYSRQILNYCVHQLNSREEAEDAVQTTFMNAFRGLKRGIVPEAEQAWLFKIAENVCLSRRRSSWRRGKVESPNDFEVLQEIVPSKHANRADELIGLEDALEAMPENQRRAILLREWQGLSYREIADELELSQAAVETLIFRARRSLAAGLESPVAPKKRRRITAAADSLSLGSLIASLKSVLTGGAAIKAVAVAVAAGSATVAATQAEPALVHHMRHQITRPAQAVHITKQSQATFSSQATIVARASGMSVAQAHAKTGGRFSVAPAHHGPVYFRRAPIVDDVAGAQLQPTVPPAPVPAVSAAPAAPVTPAPEAPIAAAPAAPAPEATPHATTPAEQPRSEPTRGTNDNPGNGNNDQGGNGNNSPGSKSKGNDGGANVDTPKTASNGNGANGNGNDRANANNDKSTDKSHAVSIPVVAAPAPAPATPAATPAAPTQGAANNGKDNAGDNRKMAPPAPAAPSAAAPSAAAPSAAAPPAAAPPAAAPPAPATPATPPPSTKSSAPPASTGGNGSDNNSKDNGGDRGKGKGK